jgi:hypothetical protein
MTPDATTHAATAMKTRLRSSSRWSKRVMSHAAETTTRRSPRVGAAGVAGVISPSSPQAFGLSPSRPVSAVGAGALGAALDGGAAS